MYLHRPKSERATSITETYKCGSLASGKACSAPATIKREWADGYVIREVLRLLGPLTSSREETIPGYDPQPEIDATLAEFEEHQAQEGRQRSNAARAAWQRRADALDARLAELEAREKVEPRTVRVPTGTTFREEWDAADSVEARRAMLNEVGAHLVVRKGKRGKTFRLDESRVSLSFTVDFYADAAEAMQGIIEAEEREAAGIDW